MSTPSQPVRQPLIFPVLTVTLVALGIGALIAAISLHQGARAPGGTPTLAAATPSVTGIVVPSVTVAPSAPNGPAMSEAITPKPIPLAERADPEWVREVAKAGEIPERVMAAYAGASLMIAIEEPTCNLGWNTLAAIGFAESGHGTINGAQVGTDGTAEPAIVGPQLDGSNGTRAIADSDGGELDGDVSWDRAVGPMQFIPSSWEEFGQDANHDGTADPQQIDDAVLTAAKYLCEFGGDLSTPGNWIAAVHAYNPSVDYNNIVADAANCYAALV